MNRTVGSRISGYIAKKYGNKGFKGSINLDFYGSAGQSFGAFNNSGITLVHKGTCNDGVGKACTGGIIVVKNPGFSPNVLSEKLENNVLVGNFALFGATGGELFVHGQAGDRFGVRNSGAVAVVGMYSECVVVGGGGTNSRIVVRGVSGGVTPFRCDCHQSMRSCSRFFNDVEIGLGPRGRNNPPKRRTGSTYGA